MRRLYQQLKNVYHLLQAAWWRAYYQWPDRALTIYGVTGTNGKTTTCFLLASILEAAYGADRVGMLTTIAFRFGQEQVVNATKMTTLGSRQTFRYLAHMRARGVTQVVLEMTSHALDQHRLRGITLAGAVLLNITREHLDYHGTMEEYARAKQLILTYLRPTAPLVGKADDERVAQILTAAQLQAIPVHRFTSRQAQTVTTPLPGEVNKENVLTARLLMRAVGIDEPAIAAGIAAVRAVPGRMEWVEGSTGVRAIIDYAVTPDALERLYQHVRSTTAGKIFAILGAAGLRDRGKRPGMARVVARYADALVLTSEDPWTESPEQIFHDLEAGLKDTTTSWRRMADRRAALRWCLTQAQPGDVIVATGKGAERGMGIGKKIIPWHERTVIAELMKELKK